MQIRTLAPVTVLAAASLSVPVAAQCHDFEEGQLAAPSPQFGQRFGAAVATHGDWIFVGMPSDGSVAPNAGTAYVFRKTGGTWDFVQELDNGERLINHRFGEALSCEADTLFVSSPGWGQDRGAVYVFELQGGLWIQTQRLNSSPMDPGERFGEDLETDGSSVIVGTRMGGVDVYTRQTAGWFHEATLQRFGGGGGNAFGAAVAIDGDWAVVGAPGGTGATGAGYVYERFGGLWLGAQVLSPGESPASAQLGQEVAVESRAGGPAVVLSRAAYAAPPRIASVFTQGPGGFEESAVLRGLTDPGFDQVNALALEDGTVAIGQRLADAVFQSSGAVLLFEEGPLGWVYRSTQLANGLGGTPHLGSSLDLSGDVLVAGAPRAFQESGRAGVWDLRDTENAPFCTGAANSASTGGSSMDHVGGASLSQNSFVLRAMDVPAGQPGLFFYSFGVGQQPLGDGVLCAAAPQFRIASPVFADGAGFARLHLDFSAFPASQGAGAVSAGDRIYAQFWYRDPGFGGAGFNVSEGLSVLVCP